MQQYSVWLAGNGKETVRHRIPLPGGGYPFTNIFNKTTNELIEANASAARVYVRAALGQAVDYSRFLKHERRSLLLPIKPAPDLVDLLHEYAVGVIWPAGQVFDRSGLPIAE